MGMPPNMTLIILEQRITWYIYSKYTTNWNLWFIE